MINLKKALLIISLMSIFLITICSCGQNNQPIELDSTEVKEYKGKKLSSINDFRENSIKGPQYIKEENYNLKITGLVNKPQAYSYNKVIEEYQNYKKVVTLKCVEGWSVTILWEGFLVRDLLKEADIKPEAKIVIFKAFDGYSSSLPLDYLIENDIIIAYKMNEVILPPERGFPFQLVAEKKWGYKWVKWITEIELSDKEDYKGYWENRGYSNEADLDKNFFNNN